MKIEIYQKQKSTQFYAVEANKREHLPKDEDLRFVKEIDVDEVNPQPRIAFDTIQAVESIKSKGLYVGSYEIKITTQE